MILEERLDDKFEEVLEARGELRDRLACQGEALEVCEKVMDIFKYTIDGLKIQAVFIKEHSDGTLTFAPQAPDGVFREYELSDDLSKVLEHLNHRSYSRNVKVLMLNSLRNYFDVEPRKLRDGFIISMKKN